MEVDFACMWWVNRLLSSHTVGSQLYVYPSSLSETDELHHSVQLNNRVNSSHGVSRTVCTMLMAVYIMCVTPTCIYCSRLWPDITRLVGIVNCVCIQLVSQTSSCDDGVALKIGYESTTQLLIEWIELVD
jgi:hypothetical protein